MSVCSDAGGATVMHEVAFNDSFPVTDEGLQDLRRLEMSSVVQQNGEIPGTAFNAQHRSGGARAQESKCITYVGSHIYHGEIRKAALKEGCQAGYVVSVFREPLAVERKIMADRQHKWTAVDMTDDQWISGPGESGSQNFEYLEDQPLSRRIAFYPE